MEKMGPEASGNPLLMGEYAKVPDFLLRWGETVTMSQGTQSFPSFQLLASAGTPLPEVLTSTLQTSHSSVH